MDKIIHFLKNQNDMDFIIEILEFLQTNPEHFDEIKEVKDLQILKSNLMCDRDEIKNEITYNKMLLKCYE